MTTRRDFVRRPAIVSAYLAPILFIGGTTVAGFAWPAYSPIRQTISELAAGDAPTRVFMTVIFVLTGLCHLTTVAFTRGIGSPGRIAFLVGALATLGVAAFPLPTVAGTSEPHKIAAMIGFILLAGWPLLGMRRSRDYPWPVRPAGAIVGTAIMTVFCLWFLVVWLGPPIAYLGIVERIAADAETLWPTIVVTALFIRSRRAGSPTTMTTAPGTP